MKLRAPMTPLQAVQRTRFTHMLNVGTGAIRKLDTSYYWMFVIAFSVSVMFMVGGGNTPKSFANTTTAATDMPTIDDWEQLAQCESNGQWDLEGDTFSGGLQFRQDTWEAAGGEGSPHEASKEEQIRVAENLWKDSGWESWPACGEARADTFSIAAPTEDSDGTAYAGGGADAGDDDETNRANANDVEDEQEIGARSRDDEDAAADTEDTETDSEEVADTDTDGNMSVYLQPGTVSEDMMSREFASPFSFASSIVTDQYADASAACKFLTACRYREANLMNFAPTMGGGDYANVALNSLTLISIALTMASMVAFWAVEILLIYVLSVDFFTKVAYVANEAFFQAGVFLHALEVGPDGNYTFQTPMVLVLAVGAILVSALVAVAVTGRGRRNEAMKVATLGLIFSGLSIVLVVRAGANVSVEDGGTGQSNVSELLADAPLLQNSASDDIVAQASDSNNWAFMSPGWILTGMGSIASQITAFTAQITNVTTNAISTSFMQAPSQCDIYNNALYSIFAATPAAQNMGAGRTMTIVAYDRMVASLFYQNYAGGALGNSLGAQNAWCRIAESRVGISPGEQAMISRVAGLNSEVVGTGGFGLIRDDNGTPNTGLVANMGSVQMPNEHGVAVPVAGGTLVAADGHWSVGSEVQGPVAVDDPDIDDPDIDEDAESEEEESGSALRQRIESGDGRPGFINRQVAPVDIAAQYFGPTYNTRHAQAAEEQAMFYWAACEWGRSPDNSEDRSSTGVFYPGGTVTIHPEWKNIFWARGGDGQQNFTKEDCLGSIISAKPGKGFGESWYEDNVDSVQSAHFEFSVTTSAVEERPERESRADDDDRSIAKRAVDSVVNGTKKFVGGVVNYFTGDALDKARGTADSANSALDWLSTKTEAPDEVFAQHFRSGQDATSGNAAQSYLMRAHGYNPYSGVMSAVISAFMAYVIVRMIGGLIFGSLLVQVVTIVAVMFGMLLLILAMIPIRAIRRGLKSVGKTIVTAMLTDGFLVFVFAAIFAINEMLRLMILPATQDVFSSTILGAFIALLSFYALNMLIKHFTNLDMTRGSDAAKLAPIAASPALASMGFMTRSPIDVARQGMDRMGLRRRPGVPGSSRKGKTPKSAEEIMRAENRRQRLKSRYEDTNAMKRRRRAEDDERRAENRRRAREKRAQKRMAGDVAAGVSTATGYGAPVAAAYKTGSTVWRPIQDLAVKGKNGATDAGRWAARKTRDGAAFTAHQARLATMGEYSRDDIDQTTEDFVDNASPGSEATATTAQQEQTGVVFPNEDNAAAFDDKVPGAAQNPHEEEERLREEEMAYLASTGDPVADAYATQQHHAQQRQSAQNDADQNNAAQHEDSDLDERYPDRHRVSPGLRDNPEFLEFRERRLREQAEEAARAHEAVPETYDSSNGAVNVSDRHFGAESAHSVSEKSSAVLNTPDNPVDMPAGRRMDSDADAHVNDQREQTQKQQIEQVEQRDDQRQAEEKSRMRKSAEYAKSKMSDPDFRASMKSGAEKIAQALAAGSEGNPTARDSMRQMRRDASAGGENRGLVGRAMRSAATSAARRIVE